MTACQTFLLVSLLSKSQELPVSQPARHVNPFHLVITDNQRPGTLSLPHGMAPPIEPTTHSSQVLHSEPKRDRPAVWPLINFFFHTWHGLYSAVPYIKFIRKALHFQQTEYGVFSEVRRARGSVGRE
jgi:hypothetical protein